METNIHSPTVARVTKEEENNNIETLVQEELKFSHSPFIQQIQANPPLTSEIKEALLDAPKSSKELMQEVILAIAMEQRAIAQLIQAEAKHIQTYIDHNLEHNMSASNDFQMELVRIVEGLVEKQKLSMRLLDMTRVLLKGD